jgi:hypothetical protein
VLILSPSSLGHLGSLLNPHGLIVYSPLIWHALLPDWLVPDKQAVWTRGRLSRASHACCAADE